MKKLLIVGIFISSFSLSSCSIDWNDSKNAKILELEKQNYELKKESEDAIFNKKQECINKKDNIIKNLNLDYSKSPGFYVSFEQIFYSKKYNNCLWVMSTIINGSNGDNTETKFLYELGNDGSSAKHIDSCKIYITAGNKGETTKEENKCGLFYSSIGILKGEQ